VFARYRLGIQTSRWCRFAVAAVEVVPAERNHVVVADEVTDPALRAEAEDGAWYALRRLGAYQVTVTEVVTTGVDTSPGDLHEATAHAVWQGLAVVGRAAAYTGFTEPRLVTAWLRRRIGCRVEAVTEARHFYEGRPDAESLVHVWLGLGPGVPTLLHGLGDDLMLHSEEPYASYDMEEGGKTLVGPARAPDLLASVVGARLTDAAVIRTNGTRPTTAGLVLCLDGTDVIIGTLADEWILTASEIPPYAVPRWTVQPRLSVG
jgi:hypothetical protein